MAKGGGESFLGRHRRLASICSLHGRFVESYVGLSCLAFVFCGCRGKSISSFGLTRGPGVVHCVINSLISSLL